MTLQNIDTRLAGASPYSARLHAVKCEPGFVRQNGAQTRASLALRGVGKLTFMTGIAAGILFAWQGIALHVQKFSVRPAPTTPVTATVARWVHNTWAAAVHPTEVAVPVPQSSFAAEPRFGARRLIDRWSPMIAAASARFNIPADWIRAVVQMESGGRTMLGTNRPMVSHAGAVGLMQLMPGTYKLMSTQFGLGADPFNPRDNIYAGTAYLRQLYQRYGYPAMFAAYNAGPGHLEKNLAYGTQLPQETRNYVNRIVTALNGGTHNAVTAQSGETAKFTRPNGTAVAVRLANVTAVRVPLPGEYARGVNTVITIGRAHQGVRENYEAVRAAMQDHGALGRTVSGETTRFAALLTPESIPASAERRRPGHRLIATARGRHGHTANMRLAAADTIRLHPISRRVTAQL